MNIQDILDSFNVSTEKYRRYISAGMVCVLAAVLWIVGVTGGGDPIAGAYMDYEEQTDNEELSKLLEDYYSAYAEGDIKTLKKLASPISDKEQSYIKLMSDYIKFYTINEIYTKPGVEKGDLLVSVSVDIKYKKLKEPAPGLDFFYVEKKGDIYHINNLYSTFNSQNGELDVDPTIIALIAAFERQEDVTSLQDNVSMEFNKLVLEDNDFNVYFSKVLPDAITDWASEYKKTEEKEAKQKEKEEKEAKKQEEKKEEEAKKQEDKKEEKTEETTAADTDTNEKSDSESESSTKTAKDDSSKTTVDTVVTTDKVNIRKKASQDSAVLGQAAKGTKFTRYKEKRGWSKVKYKNSTAWINSDYVKVEEAKDQDTEEKQTDSKTKSNTKVEKSSKNTKDNKTEKTETVYTTDKVNVRKSASQNSASLGQVAKGTKLTRYSQKDGWSQIDYNGSKAWIRSDFLTDKKSNEGTEDNTDEPKQDTNSGLSQGQSVRLSSATNVRKSMSETSDRVGVAYSGDTVTVEAVYENGWTKVNLNGKEGYIKTEFLR